jgi:hypothetical protein
VVKPFVAILKEHILAWIAGKRAEWTGIVQVIASRIREDIVAASDDEEIPEDLEEVCIKFISCSRVIDSLL